VVEECYHIMEQRLSANQGGGDDANVICGVPGQGVFRIGHTT
jgi:hypothetical protein